MAKMKKGRSGAGKFKSGGRAAKMAAKRGGRTRPSMRKK